MLLSAELSLCVRTLISGIQHSGINWKVVLVTDILRDAEQPI